MILTNAHVATLSSDDSFGLIKDAAIVLKGEEITWVELEPVEAAAA